MGEILDGKMVAARVRGEVRERVARVIAAGHTPGLHVILVGENPASSTYVRAKERACAKESIASTVHRLAIDTDEAQLLGLIATLNKDTSVDGILVQLPLPPQMNVARVVKAVDPDKDVDGFHPVSMGHVTSGRPALAACTPKGIIRMLDEYEVPIAGAHAVVLGRSRIVGRPMASLLLAANATTTICHRHTRNSAALARMADILVVAVGSPGLVRGDWIKPGAVVIDVGTTRLPNGKLGGDVAFEEAIGHASLVSPVPGGVGPMTIAMLLDNTCLLAERHSGITESQGAMTRPVRMTN